VSLRASKRGKQDVPEAREIDLARRCCGKSSPHSAHGTGPQVIEKPARWITAKAINALPAESCEELGVTPMGARA